MRRLAAIVALALVCTGAALAAKGDPQKRHNPVDTAKAKSVVLRAADLAGWKAEPAKDTGDDNLHCKGFDPDESDLVETGNADSPDFSKGLQFISSTASVYRTSTQAQASWDRVVKPGLLTCLKTLFEQGASTPGTTWTVLGQGTLSFPKLASRTAAFRIAFRTKSSTLTLKGSVDIVLLGHGRIDAVMLYVAFGAPSQSLERRLAGLMAARMG